MKAEGRRQKAKCKRQKAEGIRFSFNAPCPMPNAQCPCPMPNAQ
ncbi:MAG: hypothetical protein ACHBN1_24020 [Heteroscytonema crispum UTEX LB 1556]